MKINSVGASLRYSAQLPSGDWKTLELSATGILPSGDWQAEQLTLFTELCDQMRAAWSNQKVLATAPAIAPASTPPPAPAATPIGGSVCPQHKKSKPSRNGGLYCPVRVGEGDFCQWVA